MLPHKGGRFYTLQGANQWLATNGYKVDKTTLKNGINTGNKIASVIQIFKHKRIVKI